MMQKDIRNNKKGFVLVIVAGLLIVMGIFMLKSFPVGSDIQAKKVDKTDNKLTEVKRALLRYYETNGALPCPSDPDIAMNDVSGNFGEEIANCSTGLVVNGTVIQGGVPVKTLGLPLTHALDDWGNRLTYVMDSSYTGFAEGGDNITVFKSDGTTPVTGEGGGEIPLIMGLIISHGEDGVGAYNRGDDATAVEANACAGAANTQGENCDDDATFLSDKKKVTVDAYGVTTILNDDMVELLTPCPLAINGCVAWFDGTNINGANNFGLLTGDSVATWVDKSGNGFSVTALNDPRTDDPSNTDSWFQDIYYPKFQSAGINSKGSVLFDGSGEDFLNNSTFSDKLLNTNNKLSVISVAHGLGNIDSPITTPGTGYGQGIVSYSEAGGAWYASIRSLQVGTSASPSSWATALSLPNIIKAPMLRVHSYDGTTMKGYVNGSTPVTQAASVKFTTKDSLGALRKWQYLRVGRSGYGDGPKTTGNYMNGNIGEIMIFDSALSDTNREKLECYMARKWGVFPRNGLQLWLDANDVNGAGNGTTGDGYADGDPVTGFWVDKSGNSYSVKSGTDAAAALLAINVDKPVYRLTGIAGLPAIEFDGSGTDFMSHASLTHAKMVTDNQAFTVFSVIDANDATSDSYLSYNSQTTNLSWILRTGSTSVGDGSWATAALSGHASGSPMIRVHQYSQSQGQLKGYINTVLQEVSAVAKTMTTDGWERIRVGRAAPDTATDGLNGKIGEILFYNRVLSDGERKVAECYLSGKWDVTIP